MASIGSCGQFISSRQKKLQLLWGRKFDSGMGLRENEMSSRLSCSRGPMRGGLVDYHPGKWPCLVFVPNMLLRYKN